MIPVEMIGHDVENDGYDRLERANRFELKRRDFGDHPIAGGCDGGFGDQRVADVAADPRLPSGEAKEFADQRGRRRLPFGSTYGDDGRGADAVGYFDLAVHGHPRRLDT